MSRILNGTLLILLLALSLPSKSQQPCLDSVKWKSKKWFRPLVARLAMQNKIDAADAHMIKMLSSSSEMSNMPDSDVIKQYGKIAPSDIIMICLSKGDDIYVHTRQHQYVHLFVYNTKADAITRIKNKGPIVTVFPAERLMFSEEDATTRTYTTYSQDQSRWVKYFVYDKSKGTFAHVKNCWTSNGRSICEDIK